LSAIDQKEYGSYRNENRKLLREIGRENKGSHNYFDGEHKIKRN
jgi:hypothetical protein